MEILTGASDMHCDIVSDGTTVPQSEMLSGIRKEIIELKIRANIARLVFRNFKNPLKCFSILRALDRTRRKVTGENRIRKIAKVDGKFYWDLYIPSWPSKAFDDFFEGEINRIAPMKFKTNRFSNIFVAVTKKCSLKCEHCFEWDALNGKEKLASQDVRNIIDKFQEKGTGQILLTGGEPLLRIKDILEILKDSGKQTEFWVLTSGYQLTFENAQQLRSAGLTGIVISLDHFQPDLHNNFRGFDRSFEWVRRAVKNAVGCGLVTALSICVTKSFISESNLMSYSRLAKKMGVSFIQVLEPKAVGHYKCVDVLLSSDHINTLESFYLKMNYEKEFREFPVISYPGYHQRRIGCFAAGNRNLYVDTDGDIHACPFCQKKTGSALSDDIDNAIGRLQARGCHDFRPAQI